MVEKLVVVHRDVLRKWLDKPVPPKYKNRMRVTMARIDELRAGWNQADVIELVSSNDPILTARELREVSGRFQEGDTALVVGVRETECVKRVENSLGNAGIPYRQDKRGIMD